MVNNSKEVDLKHWKKLFQQSKYGRSRFEVDWYMNLSYFLGDQWIFWNRGFIDRPRLEDWRVMFVDNRIRPIVVARAAKKTRNRPTFICIPATADEDDMHGAQIGEKILKHDWKVNDLDYKHLLAEFWVEICGAGFWKIYWDKTKGKGNQFVFGPDNKPVTMQGAPVKKDTPEAQVYEEIFLEKGERFSYQQIAEGDVAIDVISPFELFPDPLAKSLDECEWVIEEKIRSKEHIRKYYGEEYAAKASEDANIPAGIAESRMLGSSDSANQGAKGVRLYEAYSRETKDYPNGLCVTWFGDTVIRVTDNKESSYADFPYVMFQTDPAPGRFYPRPLLSDLRGPQTDLNKIQSQIRENAIRVGNPPIAISREANVEWKGRIGEKVYFSDTVQNPIPKPIEVPEVPIYVREEVQRIENSMREISGIHEISNAKVPTGVTAASAINLLMEADDTRLGPEIQMMEKNLAIAGEYILRLRAKHTKNERIIRIAGEDGGWDISAYQAAVLNDILGVETQAGSAMPQSKAARQAAMTELLNMALQYQVPLNPRAMRRFFEDYEMGGLEKLFQDLENDETQVTRENRKLYNDEMVTINIQDNDDIHIESHEDEMKTAKYEKSSDTVKGKFIAHLMLHKQRRVKAVNEQMASYGQEQAQREAEEQEKKAQLLQLEGEQEAQLAQAKIGAE